MIMPGFSTARSHADQAVHRGGALHGHLPIMWTDIYPQVTAKGHSYLYSSRPRPPSAP